MAMGLIPIMWTSTPAGKLDTDDWRVPAGLLTGEESIENFQSVLAQTPLLDTG